MDGFPPDGSTAEKGNPQVLPRWLEIAEKTTMAGRRLDQIESDHVAALVVGSSPANTNNALRTLRRML
jgi:hypothetical protein